MGTGLVWICASSFASVFCVLAFLAVMMRILTTIFSDKEDGMSADPAVLAAISAACHRVYPGTQITRIEEIK
ncbi:MAG: hypothetical protein DRH37_11310 [Deltaproteobacteria bacterium]|nr:MAG: hypothetical protein DRH37_11310 [Deltaproteobacteria bacterium]